MTSVKRQTSNVFAVGLFECMDGIDQTLERVLTKARTHEIRWRRTYSPHFLKLVPAIENELETSEIGMRQSLCSHLLDALAGLGARIWRQDKEIATALACGENHALGHSEFHFSWSEVRDDDR